MASQDLGQSAVRRVAWQIFFYAFALFNWLMYLGLAIRRGTFFQAPTEQDQLTLAISRDRFWNLSKQPIPGFEHAFFKLRNGLKLHYITNQPGAPRQGQRKNDSKNLIIFLHGFPDSCMMWRRTLAEPAIPLDSARLICLDLPNYGGSDTFETPDSVVLEAITEFIVAMREQHEDTAGVAQNDYSTIIVAHDWGCVIGFRLAAEAAQLADRFILSNGPHVGLALTNTERVLSSSTKIFKLFRQDPWKNFGCLKKSYHALRPLLLQVLLFGYIFAFHLPKPMVKYLGTGGHFSFLRGIGRLAHGTDRDEYDAQESLAATFGPGIIEVKSKTGAGDSYGQTVASRAESSGEAWWHQTAYYRNGLATGRWEKSLETIADLYNIECESSASTSPVRRRSLSSSTSALFGEQYHGTLKAPATILWGENDLAVGKAICLDGIPDYLPAASEIVLLPRTGHWTPVEKESRAALAAAVNFYASCETEPSAHAADKLESVYEGAHTILKK